MTLHEETNVARVAERLRALSEPNRLRLIAGMCGEPEPAGVGKLAECCEVDLSVVSRHLKALREAGLVTAEKEGREVRYCCDREEIASMLRELADWIENCCPADGPDRKGGC